MSKQMEAFEKDAMERDVYLARDENGFYIDIIANATWEAWQASRAAALEEAASLVSTMIERGYGPGLMPEMLRALKEQS